MGEPDKQLLIALPSKGRLKDVVDSIFRGIGILGEAQDSRVLIQRSNWPNVRVIRVRTEDIPHVVGTGRVVLGVTGHDYVVESGAQVEEVLDLGVGVARLVVAVPRSSGVSDVRELSGATVATKYVNIARAFFEGIGVDVRIVRVSGSVEVMPYLGIADAVVDVSETGATLESHGLVPIGVVMETSARVITPRDLSGDERAFIENVVTLIRGYLSARRRRMIFLNVPGNVLSDVLSVLPAMEGPMVARVASRRGEFFEVMSVVDEREIPSLVARLRSMGVKDIVILSTDYIID